MIKKIKQLFCQHKDTGYYTKISKYYNLRGEHIYKICRECGKIIESEFISNEEFNFRFRYTVQQEET